MIGFVYFDRPETFFDGLMGVVDIDIFLRGTHGLFLGGHSQAYLRESSFTKLCGFRRMTLFSEIRRTRKDAVFVKGTSSFPNKQVNMSPLNYDS